MDLSSHKAHWEDLRVSVVHRPTLLEYPGLDEIPFDPDTSFPEYKDRVAQRPNPVYDAVRHLLRSLHKDEENFGTEKWNPLRGIVEPGMKVVLKPNLVADSIRGDGDLSALFTHTSVIRPVVDYVRIALRGRGTITIGDAPIQRTDWDNLQRVTGLRATLDELNRRDGVAVTLVDFRREITVRDRFGMVVKRDLRDAIDFVEVDLAKGSTLTPVIDDHRKFRVSQYDPSAIARHHNHERNCYMIHRCVLDADLVIGLPKLKVHKKAGITCSLKNMVGTVCGKDWLPHYRIGDAQTGAGDQYSSKSRLREAYTYLSDAMEVGGKTKRRLASVLRKGTSGILKLYGAKRSFEGDWYGNDTAWRMVHDLNLVLCYADADGNMQGNVQRRVLHIVDGIIGGERNSPLKPTAHPAGILLAGTNPLAVDAAAGTLLGFDTNKIPLLRDAWNAPAAWQLPPDGGSLDQVRVDLDQDASQDRLTLSELGKRLNLRFTPPEGWIGWIER